MKSFLKQHWVIIILSAAIGFIFVFPHVYLRTIDRGFFRGVDVLGSDAETHYVARVQEVYDGHLFLGSTYFWEGKNQPYLPPPFLEIATAYLGKILGMNAVQINIFAKFFFGFLLSFLLYFFVLELFGDKYLALMSSALTLLAPSLLSSSDMRSVFSWEIKNLEFLRYARPLNPAFSSLLLFGYLLSLYRLLKSSQIRYLFFCAVFLGLSFYAYFYFWTYLFLANGLFVLWFIYKNNWPEVKKIILISAGSLLIALPYLIHTVGLSAFSGYQETSERLGFFISRSLTVSKLAVFTVFFIIFAFYKKLLSFNPFFIIAFTASIFVINHQIITGVNIQNDHYHWYVITPLAGIALISTFYFYIKSILDKKFFPFVIIVCLAFFFLTGIIVQAKSYFSLREITILNQRYAPILKWLNGNTFLDSVVFADGKFSELIPAYTHNNVYYSAYAPYYLNSREDLENRFFLRLFFEGVNSENIISYLDEHRSETALYLFGLKYRYTNGCSSCFPDELNEKLAKEYMGFLKEDFMVKAQKYRLDYVVWDKKENPEWRLPLDKIEKLFEADDINVYKLR